MNHATRKFQAFNGDIMAGSTIEETGAFMTNNNNNNNNIAGGG
eukprot:CAMPEP_0181108524 /NCGR_PEP_ID=MMETSP1071-20121207/17677_1 /TAXON_ID=35127 /ORGANISM="Thalassiosira sp., Strain NH16" /LENGTH=42 /DNA_ID= /DNA_START= /DNA_END= /DNA_ORIENTATION=